MTDVSFFVLQSHEEISECADGEYLYWYVCGCVWCIFTVNFLLLLDSKEGFLDYFGRQVYFHKENLFESETSYLLIDVLVTGLQSKKREQISVNSRSVCITDRMRHVVGKRSWK